MRILHFPSLVLLVTVPLCGQTTGTPGLNDFTVNGSGSGGTSCVATNVSGSLTFSVDGVPSSVVIGALASQCTVPGLNVGANVGLLDLDAASFAVWIDGTGTLAPGNPLNPFATTSAGGVFSLSVSGLPAAGPLGGFQFAVLTPNGLHLTQAHDVTVAPTQCNPQPNAGPAADDASVLAPFGTPFTFYGTTHTDVFINDNGNLTFGAGDGDFSATEAELLSDEPRIAPCWGDFDSGSGGTITWGESAGVFTVTWLQVPLFASTDQNTFCVDLDLAGGTIFLFWDELQLNDTGGAALATQQVVGIGPGGGLSPPNNIDVSAGPFTATNPTDAIYEDFGAAVFGPFDLGLDSRTLLPSGAGVGPYSIF